MKRKSTQEPEYWKDLGNPTQRELDLIPKDHFFGNGKEMGEHEILALIKYGKDDWRVTNQIQKNLKRNSSFWGEPKEINKSISRQSAVKFIKQYLKKQK